MISGWIRTYRQMLEWRWFKESSTLHVFLYLLLKANYEESYYNGTLIGRGQVLTSYRLIASNTGLSLQQVRTAIAKLISTQEITQLPTHRNSLITICNYDRYQSDSEGVQHSYSHSLQHKGQHSINLKSQKPQKNHSSISKDKDKKEGFVKPSLEEVNQYCQERHNNVDAEQFCDYYESNGWKVGRNGMKDWKAAVRNWEKGNNNKTIAYDFKRNDRRRGNDVPSTPNYTQGF